MSKDKKKKLQGFDKAVLKRVLTHIKKYRIHPFVCLCNDHRCLNLVCTDSDR